MRQEKQYLLEEMKDSLDSSEMMILLSYQKFDVNQTASFRKDIAQTGGSMLVVKKRVFMKAAEQAGIQLNHDDMEGHIGVVFSGAETVATTKAVCKFCKSNNEVIKIVGGHFQKQLCKAADFEKIATLPNLDQMRSTLLGVFEAPMANLLATVEALLTSVPYCLENKASQGT